ncbi:MAG: DNA/RNA nuclease SfsA [Chloroflexota bacterium]|nr:DNA/RNA nuclease SfsA [Chloroflexota bacterium]
MKLPSLVAGRFEQRVNRFRVTVTVDGHSVDAHLPNSGRLRELLTPGRPCWLDPRSSAGRKTDYDLKLVEYGDVLVSVDARLPNPLFAEALDQGRLAPFQAYQRFEREASLSKSRIDFRLMKPGGILWVETKSVTLVEEGMALFPDAPTARGTRHVEELTRVVSEGARAAIVFIVQRPDARRFTPHDGADPLFGRALRRAAEAGVAVHAWGCEVSEQAITVADQITVDLL